MKKILILLLFLPSVLVAQKHDYNWIMGYNCNSADSLHDGILLDFNHYPPKTSYINQLDQMSANNVSISDKNGKLLFFSNGCRIYNKNYQVIENGDNINSNSSNLQYYCIEGEYNKNRNGDINTQGTLILPDENNDSLYYMIHESIQENFPYENGYDNISDATNILLYSKIDMSFNNGLGKVVEKNIPIVEDTLGVGFITATKFIDQKGWWIIIPGFASNLKLKIKFTNGIFKIIESQYIGGEITQFAHIAGQAKFSPDGTKYATFATSDDLWIYDFDRSTGKLSNPIFIDVPTVLEGSYSSGLEFSSNGKFLYASGVYKIFQYNLEAENIKNSMKIVAEWNGDLSLSFTAVNFGFMQRGPDCRIYMVSPLTIPAWHIIHNPDAEGLACNVEQNVPLEICQNESLPNNPNYRLGNEPLCNPKLIQVSNFKVPDFEKYRIKISPNPAENEIHITAVLPIGDKGIWTLTNIEGQEILKDAFESYGGLITRDFDISDLHAGLYFWTYWSEDGEVLSGKVVKI